MYVKKFNYMEQNDNENDELNWLTQKLKITHLINESLVKEKQFELENQNIQNETYLLNREKYRAKTFKRISDQISKLQSEVSIENFSMHKKRYFVCFSFFFKY